jgi:hypothetical protein
VSPVSKPSRFAPPRMGSGHSRLPPGQSHTLQALGLVFAVAASVFALFELTFARFHAVEHPEPPKPVAVSEQPRPAAQPDAPLVHPDVVPEPTSVAAIAATSGSAVSIHKTQPHRRNQVASAPGKAVVSTPTNKLVTSSSADAPTATKGKTAKPRHDFGF